MALPKDDWTLRWVDERPVDIEAESKLFFTGQRGQARVFLPKLVNFMEYGERVAAVAMGVPDRDQIRRFLIATDRALLVFACPVSGEQVADDDRMPYAAITACRFKIPRVRILFLDFGEVGVATSDKTFYVRLIPRKQVQALQAALAARLPAGILT
jgi:hypothetical protein